MSTQLAVMTTQSTMQQDTKPSLTDHWNCTCASEPVTLSRGGCCDTPPPCSLYGGHVPPTITIGSWYHFLAHNCIISSVLTMKTLQSCTETFNYWFSEPLRKPPLRPTGSTAKHGLVMSQELLPDFCNLADLICLQFPEESSSTSQGLV